MLTGANFNFQPHHTNYGLPHVHLKLKLGYVQVAGTKFENVEMVIPVCVRQKRLHHTSQCNQQNNLRLLLWNQMQ